MKNHSLVWMVVAISLLGCSGEDASGSGPTGSAGAGVGGGDGSGGTQDIAGAGGSTASGGMSARAGSGGEAGSEHAGAAGSGLGGGGGVSGSGDGGAAGVGGTAGAGGAGPGKRLKRVLVYDKVDINPDTDMLRGHTGGGQDEALLKTLGQEHGFEVVLTDKGADFNAANLAGFDVVAFASPDYATQELSAKNRADLEKFVRDGGGWVGWHYALWIERGWPFLSVLGGGVVVKAHVGGVQDSTYTTVATTHPIARGLPPTFAVNDDFLAFTSGSPEKDASVTIIATASLTADPGGDGHPVIWAHDVDQGRAYYSMLGHGADDFKSPLAKTLMWNALRWVAHVD